MKEFFNLMRAPEEFEDFDAIKISLASPETIRRRLQANSSKSGWTSR